MAPPAKPKRIVGFHPSVTPDLIERQKTGEGETLYLDIPLTSNDMGGTTKGGSAVFLPGKHFQAVNLLVYFHGNKAPVPQKGDKDINTAGMTLDNYMKVAQYDLRAIIRRSKRRDFVLVVPALSDGSKAEVFTAGDADVGRNFDTFLKMVLRGIAEYSEPRVNMELSVGNVVLAAHSGGGYAMGRVAEMATRETAAKLSELWCFDSLYGSQGQMLAWAKLPGSPHERLWVYATAPTAGNAATIYDAVEADAKLAAGKRQLSQVEISLPPAGRSAKRRTLNWHMGLGSPDHWGCIGEFLPQLLNTSMALVNPD